VLNVTFMYQLTLASGWFEKLQQVIGGGHGVQHPVRQPAEDHVGATRAVAGPDGGGKFVGWRHGQDDRCKSIVVTSTAIEWFGHEGTILRFVFKHWMILACLVGILVMLRPTSTRSRR